MTGSAGTRCYLDHCGARVIEFKGRRERWWNGVRQAIVTVGAAEDWEDSFREAASVNRFTPRAQRSNGTNTTETSWNEIFGPLRRKGVYLITINPAQISWVMATCLLFYCMEQLRWTAKWTWFILKQCESFPFLVCLPGSTHRLSVRHLSVILCLISKVIHHLRRAKVEGLPVLPAGMPSQAVARQHHPEKRHSVHPGGERRRHWELHLWNPVWGICGPEDDWTGRDW